MGKTYEIGVIPGDGTGPEVIAEGLKVLKAVAEKTDSKYKSRSRNPLKPGQGWRGVCISRDRLGVSRYRERLCPC